MKTTIILAFAAASMALAQPETKQLAIAVADGPGIQMNPGTVIKGAPYSAAMVNESVQTLADRKRIVQKHHGRMAGQSARPEGENQAPPGNGHLSAANAPQL